MLAKCALAIAVLALGAASADAVTTSGLRGVVTRSPSKARLRGGRPVLGACHEHAAHLLCEEGRSSRRGPTAPATIASRWPRAGGPSRRRSPRGSARGSSRVWSACSPVVFASSTSTSTPAFARTLLPAMVRLESPSLPGGTRGRLRLHHEAGQLARVLARPCRHPGSGRDEVAGARRHGTATDEARRTPSPSCT